MATDIRFVGFDNICVLKQLVSELDLPHVSNNTYTHRSRLVREATVSPEKN